MFMGLTDLTNAKIYYSKAYTVAKTQNKLGQKGFAYCGLARVCKKENKIDSAYYYYFKAEDCFKIVIIGTIYFVFFFAYSS